MQQARRVWDQMRVALPLIPDPTRGFSHAGVGVPCVAAFSWHPGHVAADRREIANGLTSQPHVHTGGREPQVPTLCWFSLLPLLPAPLAWG